MANDRNRIALRKIRERKKRIKFMVAAGALAAGIVISALAFASIKGLVQSASGGENGIAGEQPGDGAGMPPGVILEGADSQTTETKSEVEPVFSAGAEAGHVDLAGLTPSQAVPRLEESFRWNLRVSDGENQTEVPDYLAGWLGDVTDRLKSGVIPEAGQLQPDYAAVKERLAAFSSELAGQWNRPPVNSQVESYDKTSGVYTYSQERRGRALDQEALTDSLLQAVETGKLDAVLDAQFTEQQPEWSKEQAKAQYQVIGTFTTKTTENKNRNQNIKLAAEAIDGTVLKPGQEFSFNMATGNRTSEKGYQPAGAYKNGLLIEEPGGGVCQVSTTLYHAIIQSGFKTTERNAHSFAPSYVEKGQDAMVSFDGYAGPDLKFVNSGSASVVLRASFSGRELKMSVVGLPMLDEGIQVSIRSEKVRDVEPGTAVYEENPTLSYGTEKTVESPTSGSVWKSYRVLKKNGQVIEEQPLHNSSYKAKNGVIQRNTTVQNQPETEAVSQPETISGTELESGAENQAGTQPGSPVGTEAGSPTGTEVTGAAGAGIQPGTGTANPAGQNPQPETTAPEVGNGPSGQPQASAGNGQNGIVVEPHSAPGSAA